ncbi:class I SAM-dependent methyltransferase [Streptomyces sp. NBC_00211]|uniref:class I SAM-dependent methyltransferase n=1 Tax=Streptomyces sp. NBC_00211 TaxID=2975683 RepID=UPI00324F2A6A
MDIRGETRRAPYAALPEARPDDGPEGRAYTVSAEFYDLLHARSYHRHAQALAGPAAAARVGIVEVGAGTGLVTDVLIGASCVPVHAVEPAAAMRAVLLSRLHPPAGAFVGDRVTVHSCSAVELSLSGQADLAVCLRMASCLPPHERRALWHSLADLLVPAGLLFLDRPPARLPVRPTRRSLGEVRLGMDTYRGQVTARAEHDRIRCDYAYLVCRQGRVLRRAQETFLLWPLTRQALGAELADAGLVLEGGLPPDLVRVRRAIAPGLPHRPA